MGQLNSQNLSMGNTMHNQKGRSRAPEFSGTFTSPTYNRNNFASALNNQSSEILHIHDQMSTGAIKVENSSNNQTLGEILGSDVIE